MNDSKLGITRENLLLIVPPALTHDPAMMARAAADAEALAARLAEIDRVRIISNIDALDETVLDILARDFKVDWYDPNYSLEEKRRTVKSSWRVHKTLGTKAAVETAIRAIYPLTTVEEWFEYGGEPYHFRLNIDITSDSGDRARQKRVLERLNFCGPTTTACAISWCRKSHGRWPVACSREAGKSTGRPSKYRSWRSRAGKPLSLRAAG